MRACILAGGPTAGALDPLTRFIPLAMAPVLNRPLIGHIITALVRQGVDDLLVTSSSFPESIDVYLHDGVPWRVRARFALEGKTLGSAASLRRVPSFFTEPVLVVPADALVEWRCAALVALHRRHDAALTLLVAPVDREIAGARVAVDENGLVTGLTDGANAPVFTGIALVAPQAVKLIPRAAMHADIAKDLVPAVLASGLPVAALALDAPWRPLRDLRAYWELNLDLLSRPDFQTEHLVRIAPNVWSEVGTHIHPSALDLARGPVLIGRDCRIGAGASILGPAVIGNHSVIDRGASITRSIVLDRTYIGRRTELDEAIIRRNLHISVPRQFGTAVEESFIIGEVRSRSLRRRAHRALIAVTDRFLALAGLVILSPLFGVLAILTRWSPGDKAGRGPVFYRSRRVARPSETLADDRLYAHTSERSVDYYVLRTMYVDAAKRLDDLAASNIYEAGPYRKIKNDPRVTRIGRFLRKTSLDELPLLFNVLRGDLSLVGVWALPTYEAEELAHSGLVVGRVDLSETARLRFGGRLGLAGFWQARGRSGLSAEERATHDAFQAALSDVPEPLDRTRECLATMTYGAYLRIILETFWAAVSRRGSVG